MARDKAELRTHVARSVPCRVPMPPLSLPPARAPVRPRVLRDGSTMPLLLEEEIAALLHAGRRTVVHLFGGRGLGKTTALVHLAATFVGEARLQLFDGRVCSTAATAVVTVVACRSRPAEGLCFDLLAWTDDEVLEYLLAVHPEHIARAFASWRSGHDHDLRRWPGTCRRVLDVLATEPDVGDPLTALALVLQRQLAAKYGAATAHALRMFLANDVHGRRESGQPAILSHEPHLLGSSAALGSLAADSVLTVALKQPRGVRVSLTWSAPLRTAVAHALRSQHDLAAQLLAQAAVPRLRHRALVLSSLCATWPSHRPTRPPRGDLRRAWLRGVDLCGMRVRARLQHAELGGAALRGAHFDRCDLAHANLHTACAEDSTWSHLHAPYLRAHGLLAPRSRWPAADLSHANLGDADLEDAVFAGASLRNADLQGASLIGADLSHTSLRGARLAGADLQDARCGDAHFEGVDLRATRLAGAICDNAWFVRCNFAGVDLPGFAAGGARFTGSDLTGTRWHDARLAGASFAETGLAEIDWEGADLRGCDFRRATFHLGNSRSGLIDSTIASEGSRTGYYTDESLEDRFQAPEDVRKANLRGCDLRGAEIEGTDFYLVDVRGALLDPEQRTWLRRCRAILDRE